jgi:hypothetical protein
LGKKAKWEDWENGAKNWTGKWNGKLGTRNVGAATAGKRVAASLNG